MDPRQPSPVGAATVVEQHHVVVLLYNGVQLLDVTGPIDAFSSANAFGASYAITNVSISGEDVITSSGARFGVDSALSELPASIGTLLVPGSPNWRSSISNTALLDAIRLLSARSKRTVSICAGAFPLAATGLLQGRRVATHWKLAAQLARAFPKVHVDSASIFVRDGKFVTSAGVTAGIDLTLSLIEQDAGSELAREVAKDLVVFMARPGNQSQFSVRLDALRTEHSVVQTVLDLITENPRRKYSLAVLAAAVGVSTRHLTRIFREETGKSPLHFVNRIRLEAACTLLHSTNLPLSTVATKSGVGSSESLRRLFLRELGITPGTYRARFKTTEQPYQEDSAHPATRAKEEYLGGLNATL
ncbi:GlxA family transcriptional regulator [Arthrobacter crusticola]|uniref:GlxA family transcriptional regulator n=1 Tax=Arthrobacter crusticola TaxID=2547960 RepID=A0A4R5TMT5_9MICC|nr:GlxA family transcriptional regulator [Arthrobacter crusticola]TDK23931.1 GlxA family transcriptional regulator [Arthrobacter crusticola]